MGRLRGDVTPTPTLRLKGLRGDSGFLIVFALVNALSLLLGTSTCADSPMMQVRAGRERRRVGEEGRGVGGGVSFVRGAARPRSHGRPCRRLELRRLLLRELGEEM